MTKHFDGGARKFIKKIAKNDISKRFPLGIFAVYCFSIVSIALLITFSAFRVMQKIPIVNRLRITE